MRVDALHRRVAKDVGVLYDAVTDLFPARMPPAYEDHGMNIRPFIAKMNEQCNPFNVYNQISEDVSLKPNEIVLSGLWLAQSELPDDGSDADVRVLWHMHPKTKRVQWSKYYWNRRRFYFWELMMHETIHRHQPTSNTDRDPRVYRVDATTTEEKAQQEYLGNTEEIETHAHDAALELYTWWPELSLRQAIQAAKTIQAPTPSTYMMYMKAFANSPEHPALRHFKRKLTAWYDVVRTHSDFYHSLQLAKIV